MAAEAKVTELHKERTVAVKAGQIFLNGKIKSVEKFQTKDKRVMFRTRILMKGFDEFGYPKAYDVVTDDQIGKSGEVVCGISDTSTFVRDWETKPTEENGGEVKRIAQIELSCFGFEAV